MAEQTVEGYIASFPDEVRQRLTEIRRRVHAAVPDAGETIKYRMPAFTVGGRTIVHVGAWRQHIAIYPVPTGDEAFERDIAPYRAARSTVRFPLREPVPYDLVDRLIELLAGRRR